MKRILVIDDEPENLHLIQAQIKYTNSDYEVILCNNGYEGIQKAISENPDLILLDLLMPGMDGYQVCQKLKAKKKTSNIPVIMISALGDSVEVRVEGLRKGAEAFLPKPVDPKELNEVMNVVLRFRNNEENLKRQNRQLAQSMQKMTQELHDDYDRFLQVSDHDLQFFWEIDTEGRITYVSSVAEKLLGYAISELNQSYYLNFFKDLKEKRKLLILINSRIKRNEAFKDEEFLIHRKDGTAIWMSISGFPVYDKNKTVTGYRGINHDITLRKKVEFELKRSLDEIKEYQSKLKLLNTALTLAEEREKRKIAELLHDGLGPTLSLSLLKISSVMNKPIGKKVKGRLIESEVLIQNAIELSRSLTYELSPPILYEMGLEAAIRWHLEQIKSVHEIETHLVLRNDSVYLNEETRILLYRILSELIMNIVKHAIATRIDVEISKTADQICLIIQDNGKLSNQEKLAATQLKEGIGLFLVKERLDSIRGTMISYKTDSAINTVRIMAPLN